MGACCPDGVAGCFALVAAEIVEDDDISLGQGRGENFLGIEGEELERRVHAEAAPCLHELCAEVGDGMKG